MMKVKSNASEAMKAMKVNVTADSVDGKQERVFVMVKIIKMHLLKVFEAGIKSQTKPNNKTDLELLSHVPEASVFLALLIALTLEGSHQMSSPGSQDLAPCIVT